MKNTIRTALQWAVSEFRDWT